MASVSTNNLEKIAANNLSIGMFVSELDRPWLGTPFLLEGVLIEEQEQIDTMMRLCEFVFIDITLSVGEFDIPKISTAAETEKLAPQAAAPSVNQTQQNNAAKIKTAEDQFSFFEVLKEIKKSQKDKTNPSLNNIRSTSAAFIQKQHQTDSLVDVAAEPIDAPSVSDQMKSDISGILAGFRKRKGKSSETDRKSAILAEHLTKKQAKNNRDQHPVEKEIVQVYPAFEKSQVATREIFESIAHDKHINVEVVHEALDGMVDSIERNPDALMWLAKLKQSDNEAYNHAMNVSITMMALANFMALPKKQVKDLGLAGLLQDIGKAKIDPDLLHKEDKITAADYEVFKKHVEYTIELLNVTDNITSNVIQTVSQHHERIDGSGYPNKLIGKQIALTGQLAGLVDTYCALTTDRAYAKGVYNQVALEEIHQCRDSKFSGVLIDQIVQFLGMYPVTSLVELNTGEVGVVIEQNSVRRLLPRVLILLNPDKTKNEYPSTINLLNAPLTPNGEPYAIVRGLPPDSYDLNPNNYYAE